MPASPRQPPIDPKRGGLSPPPALPAIRKEYERHGAGVYYRRFGSAYRNPHEPVLRRCLRAALLQWPPDLSHVLDFACGSGEVTLALLDAGAARVDGADPYTHEAYLARTGLAAERLSFEDVAAGALAGRRYSLIACSFALHLCEASRLPAVAWQFALAAPALLVLTPHKRPEVREAWGWRLEGEFVLERVRARRYLSVLSGGTGQG